MAETKNISKKAFFEVKAPLTATKITLYATSPAELEGKVVKLDLTRILRGKSLELKLRVLRRENELVGQPVSLELIGSYIRRMFRKGVDYVEESFATECKDARVVIKPFLLTRNKVSRAVRKELRKRTREHLEALCKTRTSEEILTELTTNKIQRELSFKLKKIYPLALCEIRMFKIVEKKK